MKKLIKGKTIEQAIFWFNQGSFLQLERPTQLQLSSYPKDSSIHNTLYLVDPEGDLEARCIVFSEVEQGVFELKEA